jgi:hypothetical protein
VRSESHSALGSEYNFLVKHRTGRNVVEVNIEFRAQGTSIGALLTATLLVTSFVTAQNQGKRADSQPNGDRQPAASEVTVIQGRITAIQAALITLKMPDDYPGAPGGHPQFVTAGPTCRVDVSRARFLLSDGTRADKKPLAVGDRVLVVLSGPVSLQPLPGNPTVGPPYLASIVERVVQSDKILTH